MGLEQGASRIANIYVLIEAIARGIQRVADMTDSDEQAGVTGMAQCAVSEGIRDAFC